MHTAQVSKQLDSSKCGTWGLLPFQRTYQSVGFLQTLRISFLGKKFLSCFLGLGLEKKEVRVLKALKSRRSNNQETFF